MTKRDFGENDTNSEIGQNLLKWIRELIRRARIDQTGGTLRISLACRRSSNW